MNQHLAAFVVLAVTGLGGCARHGRLVTDHIEPAHVDLDTPRYVALFSREVPVTAEDLSAPTSIVPDLVDRRYRWVATGSVRWTGKSALLWGATDAGARDPLASPLRVVGVVAPPRASPDRQDSRAEFERLRQMWAALRMTQRLEGGVRLWESEAMAPGATWRDVGDVLLGEATFTELANSTVVEGEITLGRVGRYRISLILIFRMLGDPASAELLQKELRATRID